MVGDLRVLGLFDLLKIFLLKFLNFLMEFFKEEKPPTFTTLVTSLSPG